MLNHTECNELKTESKCNTDLESPTVYLKHPVVDNKKTTKQKPGKIYTDLNYYADMLYNLKFS